MERINLDVCGQLYAVPKEVIENGPLTRLTRMYKTGSSESEPDCIVINRPPESFSAILAFYQTGELHIPMTSCPGAFMGELEYWEISPDVISDCCYNRLQNFLDEQDTLNTFKDRYARGTGEKTAGTSTSTNCIQRLRAKLWEITNYTKPSVIGKIYLFLTFVMILVSIFVLAYSTDPSFHREMTNCERLEYMASSGMENYDLMKPYLQALCSDSRFPTYSENLTQRLNASGVFSLMEPDNKNGEEDFKTYVFFFIHNILANLNTKTQTEDVPPLDYSDYPDWLLDENSINSTFLEEGSTLMISNVSQLEYITSIYYEIENMKNGNPQVAQLDTNENVASMETHTSKLDKLQPIHLTQVLLETKNVKVPNWKIKMFTLTILEYLTTIFFTVEVVLRLSTCPNIKFYFLSVINCSDALSLLGAYLYFILYILYPHLRYGSWIDYLAYLQMLRSLRLFRIVLNMRAGRVLAYSVRKNIKDLSILALFLFAGMSTFASCIYIAEDNPNIVSIPDAWYLSVITMTTVGYGDIHPQTNIGRFFCCLCAVAGVVLLALTVPIFANHFLILYNHLESENVIEKFQKKKQKLKESRQKIMNDNKANIKENPTI